MPYCRVQRCQPSVESAIQQLMQSGFPCGLLAPLHERVGLGCDSSKKMTEKGLRIKLALPRPHAELDCCLEHCRSRFGYDRPAEGRLSRSNSVRVRPSRGSCPGSQLNDIFTLTRSHSGTAPPTYMWVILSHRGAQEQESKYRNRHRQSRLSEQAL